MTEESGARAANLVPGEDLDLRERQIAVLGSWRQIGHVIYALAELSVADLLAAGPRAVEDLAAATQSNPAALRRVLRCAAAVGIFCEQEDGQFAMTALAEGLLSERAGSLRPMVLFGAADVMRLSYAGIMYSLRTGEPSFDQAFGVSFDEYLAANPEIHKLFIDFKAHWSRRLSDRFAGRLASGRFSRIADIRGGNGYLLSQVIKLNRTATGVLFDLPSVVADAGPVLKAHGVTDRVSVVGGDVLTDDLPADCDAYILNAVLHNLPEKRCELLLRRVRQTMADADSRLIVIDQVVPPLNQWDHSKVIDIDMLVLFGGMERGVQEWQRLFVRTGFELVSQPASRGWAFLEVRPAQGGKPSS